MNKINKSTKIGYGIGCIAIGVKDAAFNVLLLFYYTQVLGLKGSAAGTALMIGLCVDAITDPIMGSISDNFSSRYGRRHPFMFLSAIPFSIFLFALFCPIEGLGQAGLFLWMTFSVVAVRVSLTVFLVPYLALGAEISEDYVERTKLSTYRTTFMYFGGVLSISFSLATIFSKTPVYENGQMNPAAYPEFGIFISIISALSILICVYMTRKEIPRLPKPHLHPQPFSLQNLIRELKLAFQNPSLRIIAAAAVISGITNGLQTNLIMHMGTYFWEFTSEDMAVIYTSILIASVAAFIIMKPLERYDKRKVFIISCVLASWQSLIIVLRLFNVLPENGDPLLLKLVYAQVLYSTTLGIIQLILIGSIIADAVDEGEVITKVRQEGIYFSFLSFTAKAVSGFGALFAGMIIDLIGLPAKATPGSVDPDVVFNLGFISGPVAAILWIFLLFIVVSLKISKEHHRKIRNILKQREEKHTDL